MEKTSGKNLTVEEIEALNMWINKQHGIMPNQYHHFYENGDTLIYPEHLQDLLKIDQMYSNRLDKERHKQEAKNPKNNPLKQQHNASGLGNSSNSGGSNFYNRKYVYRK